jgi:hypothetical protein
VTVTAPWHSVHQIMTSELIDLIGGGLATSSQTEDPFSKTTWLAKPFWKWILQKNRFDKLPIITKPSHITHA